MTSCKMYDDIRDQVSLISRALKSEHEQITRLRRLLASRERLWIVGMGSSLIAANAAAYGCEHRCCQVIESTDVLQYKDALLEECDLALVVSQSGESFDTVAAAQRLVGHGVEVWAVTNRSDSRLARMSKEVVLLHAGEESGSATKTFTISLALLASLIGGAITSDTDGLSDSIAKVLEESENVARWARLLSAADKVVVLGSGRDKFIAQEAALMLQEKARIFALGMSAAEFIHGPLEIVEPGTPVILIETGRSSWGVVRVSTIK